MNSTSQTGPSKTLEEGFQMFLVIGMGAGGFVVALCNILVIGTFIINQHLRKKSMYFLFNLALTDFLFGATVAPLICQVISTSNVDEVFSVFFNIESFLSFGHLVGIFIVLSSAQLLTLTFMSLDRACATLLPLRHRRTSTRMYLICCVYTWVASGLYTWWIMMGGDMANMKFASVAGITCLMVITTSYLAIFLKVKHQHHQHNMSNLQRSIQKERRLAVTLLLVTVTSLVSWLPCVVFLMLVSTLKGELGVWVFGVFVPCGVNPLLDPLIYMYRMIEVRKALKMMVCKCSRDRPAYVRPVEPGVQVLTR